MIRAVRHLLVGFAVLAFLFPASSALAAGSPADRGYDETDVMGTLPDQSGVLPSNESGGPAEAAATATPAASAEAATPGGATATPTATPTGTTPVADTSAPESAGMSSGSLPFTGLDVGLIALMGVALLATGLALRRSSGRD